MQENNKVRIQVAGASYTISTPEEKEYVEGLAQRLDKQLAALLENSPALSINDALILCSLQFLDNEQKANRSADRMRQQFSGYMDEIKQIQDNADSVKKENEQLRREILQLRVEMQHLKNASAKAEK